ncbi:hypothetical protein L798_06834 [Zootermopsis nevadensis]|uniref:Mpv17-like protein 2 n=1 Tax=Zootermopsis nevadensis TaxID=136037 RepID=A0A067RJ38_ZOONE|nr:hypothetical protein L798_06834 [Zootermopsis nevadensis]
MATRVFMAVKTLFKKYPMASNAVVYGTLITGAEFTQQTITKKILVKDSHHEPIDKGSLSRYAIMGTLIYPNVLYICLRMGNLLRTTLELLHATLCWGWASILMSIMSGETFLCSNRKPKFNSLPLAVDPDAPQNPSGCVFILIVPVYPYKDLTVPTLCD